MPANLDDNTRLIIVQVTGFTFSVLTGACLIAANRINMVRKSASPKSTNGETELNRPMRQRLIGGCLATIALMLVASAFTTTVFMKRGREYALKVKHVLASNSSALDLTVTSSINFCEADFRDHPYVAEPSNTASSLMSYIPLALLGLLGPPSQVWRRKGDFSFAVAYLTLLAIGIGSTLLHAMLTATTQGGDELPMLWFTASTGCIVSGIVWTRWWL